jgi:ribosomal protein S18 acetylase RimI-like enzyme
MNEISYRIVESFPEPAFCDLAAEAFSNFETSDLLSSVLTHEAATAPAGHDAAKGALRIAAFRGETLVGWTYARAEAGGRLQMVNSGVAASDRRRGIYSALVRRVVDQARSQGYVAVMSRHVASNNAVIIAKLKQGFVVSGFEYSEVYGPLVRLTCLLGELRRSLYHARSRPLRRSGAV